jgi:DNA-binding CsgD family transcriptional regulator
MQGSVDVQMLNSSGERQHISVTPMLVANAPGDPPLLVHVLDYPPGARAATGSPESARTGPAEGRSGAAGTPRVAPRELEVLRLVARGRSTHEIADDLGISPHTVRNHVRHVRRKLGARTKLEAVLTAMRLGILDRE